MAAHTQLRSARPLSMRDGREACRTRSSEHRPRLRILLNLALVRVISRLLGVANASLHFAFDLLAGAFDLLIRVAGCFADFTLYLPCHVLHQAFDLVAVHEKSPKLICS